ncbi:amino acid/polyamine/organocation transporter, APC superfamily [Desulforamulus reducens MI-1]|uniref:Amino acid/polyamine/organocation transporter, APC superfamily n=1 Tax=Desulforamulus reducens (strain ATCC BAA-1160 / DSM 100696 / MI-1) TaxID=349161 RepID=A4J9H4_DESRM|nr:amino acid permease [Desulforamulus reducens]ABO51727.1 amino acid/polyamine/organocation transporter, APC superfamily [Desulforamulus reducens MI-1]
MDNHSNENKPLQRGLKNRHIQMIALGGGIGSGLFYGSAPAIKLAGPALTLGYLLGGLIAFAIVRALGELAVEEPVSGSFSYYANKYISSFAGYLTGWTYWFLWIVIGMVEITVVGVYVNFWFPDIPQWLSALGVLALITGVNLTTVKSYGEFEFWFSLIKVVTVVGMIVIGVFMIIFGLGVGQPLGFDNFIVNGGFMPNGIQGLLMALVLVMFSLGGVELIGVTAGEADNPDKTIPKAINNVIWRILIFYVLAIAIMLLLCPWNEIGTQGSPFVIVFDKMGIPAAAGIINFVVLTAALSAFNSCLFSTGRMLYNLASQNHAPKIFGRLSKSSTPSIGILFSAFFLLIAVVLNYFMPEKVFMYISSIATVGMITIWTIILVAQYKFRRSKTQAEVDKLKFKLPFWPYSIYFTLGFMAMVCLLMAFMEETRIALYVAPVWFAVLYAGYKLRRINKKCIPVIGESTQGNS